MLPFMLFFYLYPCLDVVGKLVPEFPRFGDENVKVKPVVTAELPDAFEEMTCLTLNEKQNFLFSALISCSKIKPAFLVLELQNDWPHHQAMTS